MRSFSSRDFFFSVYWLNPDKKRSNLFNVQITDWYLVAPSPFSLRHDCVCVFAVQLIVYQPRHTTLQVRRNRERNFPALASYTLTITLFSSLYKLAYRKIHSFDSNFSMPKSRGFDSSSVRLLNSSMPGYIYMRQLSSACCSRWNDSLSKVRRY